MCLTNPVLSWHLYEHNSHEIGFSIICTLLWRNKLLLNENFIEQRLHEKGFSLVCFLMCLIKVEFLKVLYSHKSQKWSFFNFLFWQIFFLFLEKMKVFVLLCQQIVYLYPGKQILIKLASISWKIIFSKNIYYFNMW